jgi:uncharacterized protein
MNPILITTIITFLAEIIGTITGLGSATFFVPSLSFFTSFDYVLGVVAFLHVFSNITRISFFWKNISKEVFLKFGISNIIFVAIGAFFTGFVQIGIIEVILGILLMLVALIELFFKTVKIPTTKGGEGLAGAIAGFFGGLVGTSGPFRSFVLINMGLTKEGYIATSVAVDFIGDVLRLFIYIFNGFVNAQILVILPLVFAASLVGALLGKKILKFIPTKYFNKLVIGLLFVLGASLLLKNVHLY